MSDKNQIGIVDIFAGPGGLSEGFASVGNRSNRPFKIALSIEKDAAAHRTLRLRSLVHELDDTEYLRYIDILNSDVEINESLFESEFPDKWKSAEEVAQHWTLSKKNRPRTREMLAAVRDEYGERIGLIGGPPCQVYSLVGRSRNAGNHRYRGDNDHRHTLYQEYIDVINHLNPAFFVMENVKGMLSSKHQSELIFPMVRRDLEGAGEQKYMLFALSPKSNEPNQLSSELMPIDHRDFIVRMEEFGVPQKRHRIIILGIRRDFIDEVSLPELSINLKLRTMPAVSVQNVLKGLPILRSGISRGLDSDEQWIKTIQDSLETMMKLNLGGEVRQILTAMNNDFSAGFGELPRKSDVLLTSETVQTHKVLEFILVNGLNRLHHHETRAHIPGDIARYIFAAAFAEAEARTPKATDFPEELAPDHKNWASGNFSDRFRVQTWKDASSTVTSHISKDGHYYIHPDPRQARSLTVREAARLQTFPDDYIFLGNRTQKYHQVGNAVPPFLAKQVASLISKLSSL